MGYAETSELRAKANSKEKPKNKPEAGKTKQREKIAQLRKRMSLLSLRKGRWEGDTKGHRVAPPRSTEGEVWSKKAQSRDMGASPVRENTKETWGGLQTSAIF